MSDPKLIAETNALRLAYSAIEDQLREEVANARKNLATLTTLLEQTGALQARLGSIIGNLQAAADRAASDPADAWKLGPIDDET
jgi:hypothetical protein